MKIYYTNCRPSVLFSIRDLAAVTGERYLNIWRAVTGERLPAPSVFKGKRRYYNVKGFEAAKQAVALLKAAK